MWNLDIWQQSQLLDPNGYGQVCRHNAQGQNKRRQGPALLELPTPVRSETISVKLQTNVNLQLGLYRGEA